MRFLTTAEAREWCTNRGIGLDERDVPRREREGKHHVSFQNPVESRLAAWFARVVERALEPREDCLLWVTQTGVWRSSENWHLYYRLRQS